MLSTSRLWFSKSLWVLTDFTYRVKIQESLVFFFSFMVIFQMCYHINMIYFRKVYHHLSKDVTYINSFNSFRCLTVLVACILLQTKELRHQEYDRSTWISWLVSNDSESEGKAWQLHGCVNSSTTWGPLHLNTSTCS